MPIEGGSLGIMLKYTDVSQAIGKESGANPYTVSQSKKGGLKSSLHPITNPTIKTEIETYKTLMNSPILYFLKNLKINMY